MKNKMQLKKSLKLIFIVSIFIILLVSIINYYEYQNYNQNYYQKLNDIINVVLEKNPNISENEIITIINNEKNYPNILNKYGISLNDSVILENNQTYTKYFIVNILVVLTGLISLLIIFLRYENKKDKELKDITKYIEEINKRNYNLNINSISEDELSILKNEIYKTTIMLKEVAENSKNDKLSLKKSLEDIHHQLKTPLTSILIMLDNLLDDQYMDELVRNEFLRDIKRQILNINFFVQTILKLSKFDANTITFTKESVEINKIINEAIKNVSPLCDLKNIKIKVKGDKKIILNCDKKWEIEAITNIIKNCVEHSYENSKIDIKYAKNNVYTLMEIKDYGEGISKKDIKNIFKRFYKGENANDSSIGIGLSLAKSIIEEENGTISVSSVNNETTFVIKYFN